MPDRHNHGAPLWERDSNTGERKCIHKCQSDFCSNVLIQFVLALHQGSGVMPVLGEIDMVGLAHSQTGAVDEHKLKCLGCGSALSKSSCFYHMTHAQSDLVAQEDVVKWCAQQDGHLLRKKRSQTHTSVQLLLTRALAKGSDDPDDGAEQGNRGVGEGLLVEHKENVSVDAGRQHQALVKVDADGNFVMPLVASLSVPEGDSEWKNGQPSGIVEV